MALGAWCGLGLIRNGAWGLDCGAGGFAWARRCFCQGKWQKFELSC